MALSVPKFLLKTTEEFWLTDRDAVDAFHKELLDDAQWQSYQLASFAYTEKPIKEGKEIVDSYFVVKVVKIFDDPKEPEGTPLKYIEYVHRDSTDEE